MRRFFVLAMILALVAMALPVSAAPPAERGERDWFIGESVLDELGFTGSGEVSMGTASNGDVITMQMVSAQAIEPITLRGREPRLVLNLMKQVRGPPAITVGEMESHLQGTRVLRVSREGFRQTLDGVGKIRGGVIKQAQLKQCGAKVNRIRR